MSGTVDREAQERKAALAGIHDEVNAANRELRELENATAENRVQASRMAFADRFLGRLEQALHQYDDVDGVSALRTERDELLIERAKLSGEIDEQAIKRRTEEALSALERLTGHLVPMLDGEWTHSPVRLNPKELTVEVYRDDRKYYLWEIGSGANWLAYHVSVLVALQQFFAQKHT